jgi:hypothetical protein
VIASLNCSSTTMPPDIPTPQPSPSRGQTVVVATEVLKLSTSTTNSGVIRHVSERLPNIDPETLTVGDLPSLPGLPRATLVSEGGEAAAVTAAVRVSLVTLTRAEDVGAECGSSRSPCPSLSPRGGPKRSSGKYPRPTGK